jgi:maltodextrin utilization protein YvdJ
MKLRILNESGDLVLTDAPTTVGIENVKKMTTAEIEIEFNSLVKEGYTPINDKTKKIMKGFSTKVDEVTMLYPIIGG